MKLTPKEKAKELFSKYQNIYLTEDSMGIDDELAKQCALIAVDELLDDDVYDMSEQPFEKRIEYWQEVKQELLKIK